MVDTVPQHAEDSQEICELAVFDLEKVSQLKPLVDDTEGVAPLFKALADDTRIKIVYALTKSDRLCVCDAAAIAGCSIANASHHLRILRMMRLVKSRREGKMVYYTLHDGHVRQLVDIALEHVREDAGEQD